MGSIQRVSEQSAKFWRPGDDVEFRTSCDLIPVPSPTISVRRPRLALVLISAMVALVAGSRPYVSNMFSKQKAT
jgi:hypothetical protein